MLRITPPMALEAPHEYVTFVERHLPRLRRDAALIVGEGHLADELYPAVLSDVAVRWGRLELLRRRLGRPGAADAYLRRAFARHARRWQEEQLTPVEVEVWRVEDLPPARDTDVSGPEPVGWQAEQLAPVHARVGLAGPTPPSWTSLALRLAPVLLASSRVEVRPLAEAAIAWWHAYETRRRRRLVVAVCALLLLLGLLSRLQVRDSDVWYAPTPSPAATVLFSAGAEHVPPGSGWRDQRFPVSAAHRSRTALN